MAILELFTQLSTLSKGMWIKNNYRNVNLKEDIKLMPKIDQQFKKQKTLAKTTITLYNMIEKMRKIGEVYE